jgi:hypothetical protein
MSVKADRLDSPSQRSKLRSLKFVSPAIHPDNYENAGLQHCLGLKKADGLA